VPEPLDNPTTVIWSHSNRQADFYELPTDGLEMHNSIGWLLKHYEVVTLWMGVETEDGAELYLTCSPSQRAVVVARLNVIDRDYSIFDAPTSVGSGGELNVER
jgi:hypothetical protein